MVGNVCEVTEGRTLLVITQVSSGLTLNKPLIQSCIRCILLCLMLTKPAPVRDILAIFWSQACWFGVVSFPVERLGMWLTLQEGRALNYSHYKAFGMNQTLDKEQGLPKHKYTHKPDSHQQEHWWRSKSWDGWVYSRAGKLQAIRCCPCTRWLQKLNHACVMRLTTLVTQPQPLGLGTPKRKECGLLTLTMFNWH